MLSMNYFNDTFLIVLQKSVIEVSSGCLDGMKLYVFLILSGIAFASYIRSDTSLVCHLFRKKSNSQITIFGEENKNTIIGHGACPSGARCLPLMSNVLAPGGQKRCRTTVP